MRLPQALLTLVLLQSTVAAATTTGPNPSTVQQAIDQLDDPQQSVRDSAEAALVSLGKSASEALHAATTDTRPEVRLRARRALRTIQLFRLNDVPDEALAIAQKYLSGNSFEHRKPQLNRLFQMQPQPNPVLARLILLEPDDDLRRQMLYQLSTGYRQAMPRLLVDDDDLAGVISILNASAEMWGRGEAADDAAALYLSGQIDEQIALCSAEQINGDNVQQQRAATQLCFLYRICGKYDQALKYARLCRDQSLIFLVLQDQGDWSAAAKEPDNRWRDPTVAASYRAAFTRLSGQSQAAMDIMSPLVNSAMPDSDSSFVPSRLFLLNNLPAQGIGLLTDQHPAVAFRMRLLRGEIPQAMEIAEKYQNHPRDAAELAQLSETLSQSLGELPEASTQPATQSTTEAGDADWQAAVDALDHKQYQVAANAFGAMWAKDHTHPDRLYLQGMSLARSDQVDRGKDLMNKAEILPLGDPQARWQFAAQLDAAGLTDVAEQQRELGLRGGGDFDEVGFSEIYNTRAENAIDRKQWNLASDALDRLCLINLSAQVQWRDPVRLLSIPALSHLVKAKLAGEHHDLVTLMSELQMYQQYLPMSSEMVLDMVPELDEWGEHQKADQLFNSVFGKLQDILKKYPKSVTYLNDLAWMSACCDRQLDAALDAANSAVRLRPDDWQVLDTLAEVRFRRGERAVAIDLEKRAVSMANDPYLARQLKRFERAAVPSATQPGAAPE